MPADYTWDASAVIPITLNGDSSITVPGEGVTVDGSTATITAAGTYSLSGTLDDGQIIVNTEAEGVVRLILNGVDIHNSTSAPIYIQKSEEAVIVLAEDTENIDRRWQRTTCWQIPIPMSPTRPSSAPQT